MKAAIVDTDVVSMLFKGDTRAPAYRVHVTGRLLGISFMTLAELERRSFSPGISHVYSGIRNSVVGRSDDLSLLQLRRHQRVCAM